MRNVLACLMLALLSASAAGCGGSGEAAGAPHYTRPAAWACLTKSASVSNYAGAPSVAGGDLDVREAGHDLYLAFAKDSSAARSTASFVTTLRSASGAKNVAATTGNVAYWRLGALTSADRHLVAGCLQNNRMRASSYVDLDVKNNTEAVVTVVLLGVPGHVSERLDYGGRVYWWGARNDKPGVALLRVISRHKTVGCLGVHYRKGQQHARVLVSAATPCSS